MSAACPQSTSQYPIPQQLTTYRVPSGSSLRRRRLAWLSMVRVFACTPEIPQTSRISSSLAKTRVGSDARTRSSVNSFFADRDRAAGRVDLDLPHPHRLVEAAVATTEDRRDPGV
jgi:hypothetical protein